MAKSNLDTPVLKLSSHWTPVSSCSCRKVMSHLFEDKAKVLQITENENGILTELFAFQDWMKQSIKDGDKIIRTPTGAIKVPSIIILNDYDGRAQRKQTDVIYNRRNVYRRDGGFCQYCSIQVKPDDWEIDHVVPQSQGGKSTFDNTVVCCTKCNRRKSNKTPEQAGMKLYRMVIKNGELVRESYHRPHKPKYNPLYNLKVKEVPEDWKLFLKDLMSNIYWDTPLD